MNFLDYCIDSEVTIKEAMRAIDNADTKIVFLTEGIKLLATLTDGDIRRFLLAGGKLSDSAIDAANINPICANDEYEAANIYHQKNYIAIPIVNDDGELEEIFFGNKAKLDKLANLKVPVVVNAGGKGTRLEPFTKILPKPLIPVGENPIIEHIMQQFIKYGCDEFHMIVNYKKELMKAYFADNDQSYNISWYNEDKPLGTGGGLCFLKGKINSTFFFTNCDNLLLANYDSMLRFHKENSNMITMICAYKNFTIPYGVIEMGVNGSIDKMTEKPELSFLTNTGIYIVEPEVLEDVEDNVEIGFPDIIDKERKKGNKVAIYPVSENDWMDMGQLSELEKMRVRLYGE